MTSESQECLSRHYDRLRAKLLTGGKLPNNCVLLALLDSKSNERYRLLADYSISDKSVPQSIITELLGLEMIRESDQLGTYVLTAKAVWHVDNEKAVSQDDLIGGIDDKYLNLFCKGKKLADKEKAILFLMITLRSFSEESAINLRQGDLALNHIEELLLTCHSFLNSFGVVSANDGERLLQKKGNEHPVSRVIRHTDFLPKKTKGLYKAVGGQKYFIDIYRNSAMQVNDLAWILWKVFDKKLTDQNIDKLSAFCEKNAYDKGIYIFQDLSQSFISPMYDELIMKAFSEYQNHLTSWAV